MRTVDVLAGSFLVVMSGVAAWGWSVFGLTAGVEMISKTRLRCAENAEKRAKIQSAKQIQEANQRMDETNKAVHAQMAEINKKADEMNKKINALSAETNSKVDALSAETRKNSAQLSTQVDTLTKEINLQTEQLRTFFSGRDQGQGRRD
jgi:ABC-type phosphate transport system auxiliary subunit